MPTIKELADSVWRNYVTPGVGTSGDNKPDKGAIRGLFAQIDANLTSALLALSANGPTAIAATRTALYALNPATPPTLGIVYADPTASYNGFYVHATAGTGSTNWPKFDITLPAQVLSDVATLQASVDALLPRGASLSASRDTAKKISDALDAEITGRTTAVGGVQTQVDSNTTAIADVRNRAVVYLTVTSTGPANAIIATTPAGFNTSNLLLLTIAQADANTVVSPTLKVDSDGARALVDRNGSPIQIGDIRGDILVRRSDANWRVVTGVGTLVRPADLNLKATQAAVDALALLVSGLGDLSAERPGESPGRFTSVLTGQMSSKPPLPSSGVTTTSDAGDEYRIVGAGRVAPRSVQAIDPGQKYRVRFSIRRRVNTTDPSGDAVTLRVRPLDGFKEAVGSVITIASLPDPRVADGRVYREAVLSLSPGTDVDFVLPAGTVYAVPYVETQGSTPTTGIQTVSLERSS